ncbi:MAG: bacillithiol biosynthesis cysteine-adding enzyme BshC [Balneolaceae bacterium]|nr:bacillithiol biosynthesis cysteine-adding enzyme BshC [Balneolaceae bacterium]
MDISDISFLNLPFNKLFQDYINNPQKLEPFFQTVPFSDDQLKRAFDSYRFKNDREKTVSLLIDYNKKFGAGEKTLRSIEKLKDENSVAVVTGQQLTLLGGPLFTVYKILSAIHFAKKWEDEYQRPCIPVFWLADEDHDYEEISTLGIPLRDDHKKISLSKHSDIERRVAEIELTSDYQIFKKEVIESQFDTDFTDQLWRKLDKFYQPGKTVGKAFGSLVLELFEDKGLILAGSADSAIKEHLSSVFIQSVKDVSKQFESLKQTTDDLISTGYHGQVHLQPSNIFWIDEKDNRTKLSYEDETWSVDGKDGKSWSSDELINEIEDQPDRFSPNVFLRPIIQNELLPGFAYIAGPGEIAYNAQMKKFYKHFNQVMPVIMPRFSITLMESGIDRIFEKLPFNFSDYNDRIEDLESQFIDQSDSPDIEAIFDQWKKNIDDVCEEPTEEIKNIDPTLEGTSEKAKATFFTELDKLKGKVYRSVKDQEKTQLDRIRKIKTNLFPNNNLQEREVAFIYFMNKYGLMIWDDLLNELENQEPDFHKVIRL